ncbi:MAG TPA: PAC2 family protein [Acidimicrobiales bacterium]|nr:PAC2 family protein [Acidimicrobiales bacterium]
MEHVRWHSRPSLDRPVLVAAFEGWNDAGDAASGVVRYLIDRCDAHLVAEVDAEEFFDFTSARPQVELDEGGTRRIVWPSTEVYTARLPADAGDLVLLVGSEPQLRWRTFCAQVTGIARQLGCRLVVILGALVAEVPHSRPVPVVGSVTDPALQERLGLQPSTYEGPTGVVGVLSAACDEAGLPSASLWAAVPTYVPSAPSPKAVLALLEHTAEMLGASLPSTDLEIASAAYERQVSELVEEDDETSDYVTQLEQRHDSQDPDDPLAARSLVEEVERFLRDRPS